MFLMLSLNNVDHRRYQSRVAKNCLATILSIQPKDSSSGGGEAREIFVQRLADDILNKLPSNYVKHEVGGQYLFLEMFSIKVVVQKRNNMLMNIYRILPLNNEVKQSNC